MAALITAVVLPAWFGLCCWGWPRLARRLGWEG